MKGLVLLAFLTLSVFASEVTFADFAKGFLVEVNEGNSVDGLKNCAKDSDAIIAKMIFALGDIMTVDPEKLKTGVAKLIAATLEMLEACSSSYSQLEIELKRVDISELVRKIQSSSEHDLPLSVNVLKALEGLAAGKYDEAGKALGAVHKIIFLRLASDDMFFDFIKGFLEGIGETGNVNKLIECMKGGEDIMKKILTAFQYIVKMDPESVLKGVKLLIDAMKEFLSTLAPCAKGFVQLNLLLLAILNNNPITVAMRIITHAKELEQDILGFIWNFGMFLFENAGRNLGNFLYLIFLAKL